MDAASTGIFNLQVRHPRYDVQNYKYRQYVVKHNSISDFIKVYCLHCFVQRHVSALELKHVVERNNVSNTP